jgi:cyclophilin family peptidyl-prolyl cis-trans isomerase
MNTMIGIWKQRLACAVLGATLAACGGESNPGGSTVTNMTATGLAYGRTMTVTVNGSRMDDPGLQMTVDGSCDNITRSANATDAQVSFTCTVSGVGAISPRVRNVEGLELGRLTANVPMPQVTISAKQGTATGVVVVELDPTAAPATVKNFMFYVNTGFYTNTIFHRVLSRQLAQGGGYLAGPTEKAATAAPIVLESNSGLKNLRGTIAMARTSDPNSATSQFYFNLADNPAFDRQGDALPGYAVFGRVISGQDVLDFVGDVPVQSVSEIFTALPVTDVVITAMVQTR